MSKILDLYKREQGARDIKVRHMLARGLGPTQISRKLGVTRQRAQQIVKRLRNGQ